MQVCVIKNTEPKNVSIPLTAAAGGAVGLGLRYLLPVSKQEIDDVMFYQSDVIKQNHANEVKKNFMENISKQFKNDPDTAKSLFWEIANAKTAKAVKEAKTKIKNSPKEIQDAVAKLRKDLAMQLQASRNLTNANIKNAVKQARSIWAFLLPGVALGALGAYVYNVIGTIRED